MFFIVYNIIIIVIENYSVLQAAISCRASGNRQISLNASAERASANFCDKKHCILQLQIFATKTLFFYTFLQQKRFFTIFGDKKLTSVGSPALAFK